MSSEMIFEADCGSFAGDTLKAYFHGGRLTIEIDEPWAGSTETGFGQTCSIGLDIEKAKQFHDWLGRQIAGEKA